MICLLIGWLSTLFVPHKKRPQLVYDSHEFELGLSKNQKKVTAELTLKDINKPIGVSEYKILSEIAEFLENTLPSIEDIEKRLERDSE